MDTKGTIHQCRLRLFESIRTIDTLNSQITMAQKNELNAAQIDMLKKTLGHLICVGADLHGILKPYETETEPDLDAKLPE